MVSKEKSRDTNKSHYQEELVARLQQKYDSIFNAQRDEYNAIINRLEQTPVVVEKPLTKWQQFRQDVGSVALGIRFAAIIYIMVWLIRKLKRKEVFLDKFGLFGHRPVVKRAYGCKKGRYPSKGIFLEFLPHFLPHTFVSA